MIKKFAAVIAIIVLSFSKGFCQEDQPEIVPHYVLVQISSESNRIHAMERAHAYKELEIVKKDAAGVMAAMMKDFKTQFTYCPVYFYIDTNVELVKARKFEGILFDTAGQTVTDVPLRPDSKDYLIVYWGFPTTQPHYVRVVKDSITIASKAGDPPGTGLIVCNYKLQQLTYFVTREEQLNLKGRYYFSKRFNIEYFPHAVRLNSKIPYIYE